MTALARYTIRAAAARRRSPAAILRWVNEVMLQRGLDALLHGRGRAPRPLGRPQRPDGRGRRPPVAARGAGRRPRRGAGGRRHAARARRRPEARGRRHRAAPGDTILLYTDGVTEAGAPQRVWTPEELIEVVAGCARGDAQQLVDHVAEAALKDLDGPPRDDIAMLALRIAPA